MRAVIQRVSEANVVVDNGVTGKIGAGFVVLLGIGHEDTDEVARQMAGKVARLRVFPDAQGKMNLALADMGGGVLAISQFTLLADARKGNRPSFADAAPPEKAEPLYEEFCVELGRLGLQVQRGVFGAHMRVTLANDGPVTIVLDL